MIMSWAEHKKKTGKQERGLPAHSALIAFSLYLSFVQLLEAFHSWEKAQLCLKEVSLVWSNMTLAAVA